MSEKPLTPSESPRVNGEPSERWKTRPPREWGNEELLDGFGCLCKESGPCVEHERLIPKEVYAEIVRRMRESCVVTVTTEAQPPVCNRQTMYCRVAHDGAAAVQRMGQAIPSDPAAMAAMPETPAEIRAMRNITLAVCRALPSIEHKLAGPIADLFTTVDAWMDLARARTGGAKVETSIGPIRVTAEETSEPPPPCDMCGAPAAKQLVSRDGGTVTRCDAHREDRSANPLHRGQIVRSTCLHDKGERYKVLSTDAVIFGPHEGEGMIDALSRETFLLNFTDDSGGPLCAGQPLADAKPLNVKGLAALLVRLDAANSPSVRDLTAEAANAIRALLIARP